MADELTLEQLRDFLAEREGMVPLEHVHDAIACIEAAITEAVQAHVRNESNYRHWADRCAALEAELSRLSAVEAELAGIKERIAAAPIAEPYSDFEGNVRIDQDGLPAEMEGQRVRLVPVPATREAAE